MNFMSVIYTKLPFSQNVLQLSPISYTKKTHFARFKYATKPWHVWKKNSLAFFPSNNKKILQIWYFSTHYTTFLCPLIVNCNFRLFMNTWQRFFCFTHIHTTYIHVFTHVEKEFISFTRTKLGSTHLLLSLELFRIIASKYDKNNNGEKKEKQKKREF